ncbi:MAG: hypothetical protein Q9160_006706 [Pyrenula sp. 1 TL-2023]
MAPAMPQTFTAGEDPLSKFGGALEMSTLPRPPNRQFEFHGYMRPSLGIYKKLIEGGKKPPTHFHPNQWEFFRVIQGNLTIDINGVPTHRSSKDPEIAVAPYTHHVIYGTPGTEMNEVEFVVSASDVQGNAMGAMDQAFFENWYGYQEDVFQRGQSLSLIQVLSTLKLANPYTNVLWQMFDAGDTYLSPPWWIPFRATLSLCFTIVLGRWIGGLLGYAPFYPEWTTDWQGACDQMEKSWTQRRFADRNAQKKARARMAERDTEKKKL